MKYRAFARITIPFLFLFFANHLPNFAQVQLNLQWVDDIEEWVVFARSNDSVNTTLHVYNSQVSIAASLDFELGQISSFENTFRLASAATRPIENPDRIYLDFYKEDPTPIMLTRGEAVPLFSFDSKDNSCPDTLYVISETDPFISPNSLSLNTGNYVETIEYYPKNSFSGLYAKGQSNCDAGSDTDISLISGQFFFDVNANGILDDQDQLLKDQSITLLPESKTTFSNKNGYRFFVPRGDYQLRPNISSYWELTNQDTVVPTSTVDSSVTVNFGLFPASDKEIYQLITPANRLRCNTATSLQFFVKNQNGKNGNGLLEITLNAAIEPIQFHPEPFLSLENTYFWRIEEVFATESFCVQANVNTPDETFTGERLSSSVKYYTTHADGALLPQDSTEWLTQIRCSYDPNDKLAKPQVAIGENWLLSKQPLEYTIRFQNTGNDTAYNVTITDQLDEHLDWSTLTPLSASHDYVLTMDKNGVCNFFFEGIYLVDSLTNPTGSQGFVTYEIYPKKNLSEGQQLLNTARIFFDENAPIITNTTKHTFTYNLST
ncbi:MAG: hypothetical protein AAGJ18_28415, partial [Bacteroidota bacterium]